MAQSSGPVSFELRERIKSVIACAICKDSLDNPRTLPCSHTFCLACLKSCNAHKKGGDPALCPQCYQTFTLPNDGADGLPANDHAKIFVVEMLKQVFFISDQLSKKSVTCIGCPTLVLKDETGLFNLISSPGGNYCYECNVVLCQPCADLHKKTRRGETHGVKAFKSRKELVSLLPAPCPTHSDDQVRYYCYECDVSGCGKCFKANHIGHRFANLRDAGSVLWCQLSRSLKRLNHLRQQAEDWMKEIQDRREKLMEREKLLNENGAINWLKRKLFSAEDDQHLSDEQKEAKRIRLEEIGTIDDDVKLLENKKEELGKQSEKVKGLETNSFSAEIVTAFKNALNECEKKIEETAAEIQERRATLKAMQDQNGDANPVPEANLSALSPAAEQLPLEKCLTLLVEYGKCRFLWKVQVYSLENLDHMKTINFAPSLSLRHTVCHIHSDTIYAIGSGRQNSDIWEFSPFSPRWTRRTRLPQPRKGCGVLVLDQTMYLFGGSPNLAGTASRDVQCFDLQCNTWTIRSDMSAAVCDPVIMEYNGLIYLFGGRTGLHKKVKTVQRYNPANGTCFNIGEMPCRGKFHGFRYNNWGIFIGRVSGCIYDFETNAFTSRKMFKSGMYYCSLTLIGDTIHMVGGRTKGREAWRYVDIKTLPLTDFIQNTAGAGWTVRKTIQPNTIRRRQRYTTTTDGVLSMSFP